MINVNSILSENLSRKKRLIKPYNQITGEGCCGDRVRIKIKDAPYSNTYYLPKEVTEYPFIKKIEKCGSIKNLYKLSKKEIEYEDFYFQVWHSLCEIRIQYDFEFFAYLYEIIEDGKSALDVPFRLKRGQRELLQTLENMRVNGIPIRVIIVKSRQLGLSTLTQLYALWIQLVKKQNWHSVICAHVKDSAINIRAMFEKVIDNIPPVNGEKYKITPFKNTQNIKFIPERGCRITVGSAENPDSVRGQNPKLVHFSEVGMFPNTTKKSTSDLISSIVGPMKREPDTMIVYESTAKGVGDFLHTEWGKAKEKESVFEPVFLPWYYEETYKEDITDSFYNHSGRLQKGTIEDFILSMSEYELNLFVNHKDCTLENINWYRVKNAEMSSDEFMKQEYPSDDIEAFQDSGLPAFRALQIESLRKDCRTPLSIGELVSDLHPTDAKFEPEQRANILTGIRFVEDKEAMNAINGSDAKLKERKIRNKLKIWEFPDMEVDFPNRYIVSFDPQKGLSEKADWGVISVIDRYPMLFGGVAEIVAEWRGRIDKDIEMWIAAQIAKYYNNALLVIECNTYDSDAKKEDYSEFIFDVIADYYDNIYTHKSSAEQIKEGKPIKYGFHTNRSTKSTIIANYGIMLREKGYKERNEMALDEARTYEQKEDGSFGAKSGHHDDILMSRMIGLYVCFKLQHPEIIEDEPSFIKEIPTGEAYFN